MIIKNVCIRDLITMHVLIVDEVRKDLCDVTLQT